jgi:hypothetical protein
LLFTPLGEPPQLIRRAGSGANAVAAHASRIPAGHPEGHLEAFAQIYRDVAEQIRARLATREMMLDFKTIADFRKDNRDAINLCALANVRREARSGLGDRGSGIAVNDLNVFGRFGVFGSPSNSRSAS